jgi:hypothetical protein
VALRKAVLELTKTIEPSHLDSNETLSDDEVNREIERLSKLSEVSYQREPAAKKLNICVPVLDRLVAVERPDDPAPGSGRPLELSLPEPWPNITAAAAFRTIEATRPTLVIDEADTFFGEKEDLGGILNSGHRRGGRILSAVGETFEPRAFATHCPVAIAQIGKLPGTLADRSIHILMKRRARGEKVARLRIDRAPELAEAARKAARWVADKYRGDPRVRAGYPRCDLQPCGRQLGAPADDCRGSWRRGGGTGKANCPCGVWCRRGAKQRRRPPCRYSRGICRKRRRNGKRRSGESSHRHGGPALGRKQPWQAAHAKRAGAKA